MGKGGRETEGEGRGKREEEGIAFSLFNNFWLRA